MYSKCHFSKVFFSMYSFIFWPVKTGNTDATVTSNLCFLIKVTSVLINEPTMFCNKAGARYFHEDL